MEYSEKVSIVVASFNSAATIDLTFKSILGQTYLNYEVILMDGLSTDETVSLASSYVDARIKIVSEKDSGIYDAWNKGVSIATGAYILFIGSDDQFYNQYSLEKLVAGAKGKPNAIYWYGNTAKEGVNGNIMAVVGEPWTSLKSVSFRYVHASLPSPIMSAIYRTDIVKSLGFERMYRVAADYEMILKMIFQSQFDEPCYIVTDTPLIRMGYGGVSTNFGHGLTCLKETMLVRKKYGLSNANFTLLTRFVKINTLIILQSIFGSRSSAFVLKSFHKTRRLLLTKKVD